MNKLILIADDDENIRTLLERHLTSLGFHVATAPDGAQATLKAKEIKPDLVILDIQMPGAYGSTVYEALKGDPTTSAIPVVFISGSLGEEAFRRRVASGPRNRFLKKPFDLKTMEATIRELLGEEKK